MAEVTELVTKFSFVGSDTPLVKYASRLGVATGALAGFTAAITGSLYAVGRWAAGITQAVDPIIQLSRTTRIAVADIQALGFAASVSGSSAEAMYASIDSLSEKIGEAAQRGSEDFARLGISVRDMSGRVKSVPEIINEISAAFLRMNLSMPERRRFAAALGIDPTLVQLLSTSNSEVAALMEKARQLGVLTKEQADAAADYNDSITTLNFALDALRQHIAVALAPEFKGMIAEIIDVISVNKAWISEGISATVAALTEMMKSIRRMIPVLGIMTAAFIAGKIASLGLAGALGVLTSPAVLLTAGIIALWLVVDDLLVAFSGGKSIIGDFFKQFDIDLTDLTESLSRMFSAIDNLIKSDFKGAWAEFKEGARLAFEFVQDLFKNLFEGLAPEWVQNLFAIGSAYRDWITGTVEERIGELTDIGARVLGGAGTGESESGRGRPIEINQTNNFSIMSNNPQAVADAVEEVLQRQLGNNNAQLGVEALGIRGGM